MSQKFQSILITHFKVLLVLVSFFSLKEFTKRQTWHTEVITPASSFSLGVICHRGRCVRMTKLTETWRCGAAAGMVRTRLRQSGSWFLFQTLGSWRRTGLGFPSPWQQRQQHCYGDSTHKDAALKCIVEELNWEDSERLNKWRASTSCSKLFIFCFFWPMCVFFSLSC